MKKLIYDSRNICRVWHEMARQKESVNTIEEMAALLEAAMDKLGYILVKRET